MVANQLARDEVTDESPASSKLKGHLHNASSRCLAQLLGERPAQIAKAGRGGRTQGGEGGVDLAGGIHVAIFL